MAGRRKKQQQIPVKGILIFLAFIAVLALIFLITGIGRVYKASPKNKEEIDRTVQDLQILEEKAPITFKTNQPGSITDMSAEQEKVMAITQDDYDIDRGKKWFEGTAIIGDSLMVAAEGYGYMDSDVICAEIGVGLETSDAQFEEAIARSPYIVFLCFGLNDMEAYDGNIDMFIEKYAERIDQLKAALPDSVFYINSVFPVQHGYEGTVVGSTFQPQYNEALKAYCEKTEDVYFIDSAFILENDQDLYDADGIHPVASFYPKWLTYVADVAGLSETEGD